MAMHPPGSSFILSLSDSCNILAKYLPEKDTVVTNGNALLFVNRSVDAVSYEWYINDLFASSGTDLYYNPAIGVNEIMLVALNGNCRDTAYSFVIWDGITPGQYSNFQKQYNPPGNAMEPFCMDADKSDGFLLAGNYYIPSENNFVTRTTSLFHIDKKGCVDWARSMTEGEEEVIQSIISTSDSGFLVSAFPFQSQQDNYPNDLHVFKLDKSGNEVWAHSFSNGTNVNNYYSAICETSDKGFVLEIGSFPLSGNTSSVSFIKIDPSGRYVWGRKLSMENNAFYKIGGILEKGNFIYATGSIYEGAAPFDVLRSFLVQIDESTGLVNWTRKNDPAQAPLTFIDIHNYKDSLLVNSYSKNLQNDLIFFDYNGNYGNSFMINNPYGSLNGKENILVARDNGIYFHQSSGITGVSHKDIIMRLDSNKQIAWQYDFSTSVTNFSGWNQLSPAAGNGISGIGGSLVPNGFKALTFLKIDSLGNGCNSGSSNLQVLPNQVSTIPMDWVTNSMLTLFVNDFPLNLKSMAIESRLLCPKYINGCDLLKLEGPGRICQAGDTGRYILHYDPFCTDSVIWAYDPKSIKVLSGDQSELSVLFMNAGDFVIRVHKSGCNIIEDSIIVSVGDNISRTHLPKDTILCSGYIMKLNAGKGYSRYLWQDGSDSPGINVMDTGIYWVRLTDATGCVSIDTVKIDSVKPLPISFLPPDTVICSGEILDLKSIYSFESYSWSTGETGNSVKIKDPGVYTLQVVDKFGCAGSDTIHVATRICPTGLFFSNAFTPNNDGHNDIFKPSMFIRPRIYRFMIYNRWGQLVFETKDPDSGWDGRIGNADQETGGYIWFCTYQFDGEKRNTIKGTVVLLR